MGSLPPRFLLTLLVPVFLIVVGTVGFHFLEEHSWIDSLYFAVITLTTVGYGDFAPRTTEAKIFTMILVILGVFMVFYAAAEVIRVIVSGEIAEVMGRRHMERTLAQMHDHIIVCGYGRMGRLVCREFAQAQVPYVLIDENAELIREADLPGGVAVVGDATADEVLKHAGIERARGLVSVMDSDANNLFATMSARLLNTKMYIVARVEDMHSEQKLLRAGANRVVSPYLIGGSRVAQAVLRPTVMDFIELATRTEHIELQMEEARILPRSALVGATLRDSGIRAELRIIILAIKKRSGEMVFNPAPEVVLEAGDILVAIGNREQLDRFEAMARHPPINPA